MTGFQATRRASAARWVRAPLPDSSVVRALQHTLNLPEALCVLLAARGFAEAEVAKRYLRPQYEHLHPPEMLKDLDVAVARLQRAIEHGETILVHGDYDVDGMCSTTLMTRAIRALGGTVIPFIPDRIADGYDLGPAGVQAAFEAGARVVLTCDCGTSAHASVEQLQARGVDVIISDHHLPGGPLPPAHAVLNPRRLDDTSPDKDLAAVGVAFKLALALTRAMRGNENVVLNMLDLVALATVADVASLRGENRVFVRRGLAMLKESRSVGLRALIRAAGLEAGQFTAGRVGYYLAPRLNALGRIGRAMDGVHLLLSDREDDANRLARQCEELNRERKEIGERTLKDAMRYVETLDADETFGLVVYGEQWHPGVIGIVASRIVERTGRPAVLIAVANGIGKGSGRSIPAFDLHAAVSECRDELVVFGGHRAAVGLTIDAKKLDRFAARFNEVARARLRSDDLVPSVRVDLEIPIDQATEELETLLRHLEPCGIGNPRPVFSSPKVRVVSGPDRIGTDGVKLRVETPTGTVDAVGWGMAHRVSDLAAARSGSVEIAYKIGRNEFRNANTLQLELLDFRAE